MLRKTKANFALPLIGMLFFLSCSKDDDQTIAKSQPATAQSTTEMVTQANGSRTLAKASLPNADYLNYIGYTEGEIGCPTVYFKEGRYTQCHSNASNIGWHPVKPNLVAANISTAGVSQYYSDQSYFLYYFVRGYYRSNASDARYFEYSQSAGTTHLSRSRLNSPDNRYSSTYAKNVVRYGKVAANEN